MRLFLASQDFGNHAERLSEMIGQNRKSLVIFNARDHKENNGIELQKKIFKENNLQFRRLDLRDYFEKPRDLRKFIDTYQPGLVVLLGGNTFLLRRALAQSGFDKIIQNDIGKDKYVLAGHSAGSIIVGPSLHGFERMDNKKLILPGYDRKVPWSGLGLIKTRIIPHADTIKYGGVVAKTRRDYFDKKGWKYEVLNDSDVLVVDGNVSEVLR